MSSPWAPAAGCSVARVQAADLGQPAVERPEQLQGALGELVRLVRVQAAEALERRDALVDLGVVLHRARAERVGAGVDAVVERRELGVVTDDVDLGDLGEARRGGAPEVRRQELVERTLGDAGRRHRAGAPPLARLLEDRLDRRAPLGAGERGGLRRVRLRLRAARVFALSHGRSPPPRRRRRRRSRPSCASR